MESSFSILIVDDHKMMVDGICSLIASIPNYTIIGTTNNGKEAINFLEKNKPTVVITDINMPEMNGIELTTHIRKQYPDIKILVLTMYNDNEIVKEIVNAGAHGCILKNTGKEELKNALDALVNNDSFFSQDVVKTMMNSLKENNNVVTQINSAELSDREKEIVTLIAQEHSSTEIADKLFISIRTVETHRKNIIKKTGVKNVVGLVKLAFEKGWIN